MTFDEMQFYSVLDGGDDKETQSTPNPSGPGGLENDEDEGDERTGKS